MSCLSTRTSIVSMYRVLEPVHQIGTMLSTVYCGETVAGASTMHHFGCSRCSAFQALEDSLVNMSRKRCMLMVTVQKSLLQLADESSQSIPEVDKLTPWRNKGLQRLNTRGIS